MFLQCAVPLVSACRTASNSSSSTIKEPLSFATSSCCNNILCASQLTTYCSMSILMYLAPSPTQRVASDSSDSSINNNSVSVISSTSDLRARTAAVLYHVEQMMFRIGRFAIDK